MEGNDEEWVFVWDKKGMNFYIGKFECRSCVRSQDNGKNSINIQYKSLVCHRSPPV